MKNIKIRNISKQVGKYLDVSSKKKISKIYKRIIAKNSIIRSIGFRCKDTIIGYKELAKRINLVCKLYMVRGSIGPSTKIDVCKEESFFVCYLVFPSSLGELLDVSDGLLLKDGELPRSISVEL